MRHALWPGLALACGLFASPSPADPPAAEAPPEPPKPVRQIPFEFVVEANQPLIGACHHCDQQLPTGRVVVYCPFCGGTVTTRACPHCGTALESAWRHCITCGYKLG